MDRQTAIRLLAEVREVREKQAGTPLEAIRDSATESLKAQTLGDVGKVALFGAGAGMAGRGAVGLYNVLRRNLMGSPSPASSVNELTLPLPVRHEEEQVKVAGLGDFLSGTMAKDKTGIPWRRPAMLLGGLAGVYGGWKGVDSVLDKRRKSDSQAKLDAAKADFQKALLESYDGPVNFKVAGDDQWAKIGQDLVRLHAELDKLAGLSDYLPSADTMGGVAGSYGGYYALPAALIAGYAAYGSGKRGQRRVALQKAIENRKRERERQQPSQIFATPVPVTQSELQ